jgi:hypothetical protein
VAIAETFSGNQNILGIAYLFLLNAYDNIFFHKLRQKKTKIYFFGGIFL